MPKIIAVEIDCGSFSHSFLLVVLSTYLPDGHSSLGMSHAPITLNFPPGSSCEIVGDYV